MLLPTLPYVLYVLRQICIDQDAVNVVKKLGVSPGAAGSLARCLSSRSSLGVFVGRRLASSKLSVSAALESDP